MPKKYHPARHRTKHQISQFGAGASSCRESVCAGSHGRGAESWRKRSGKAGLGSLCFAAFILKVFLKRYLWNCMLWKNVHVGFSLPKLFSSHCLFCPGGGGWILDWCHGKKGSEGTGGPGLFLKFANDPWRVPWNPHEAKEKAAAQRRERKQAAKARLASTNPDLFNLKKGGFLHLICIRMCTHTHILYMYIYAHQELGFTFRMSKIPPKKGIFVLGNFFPQVSKCAQTDNNTDLHGFNDQSEDHDLPSRRAKVAAGQVFACVLIFFPYNALLFLSETWAFPAKMHLEYSSFYFLQYRLYMNFLQ